MFHFFINLYYSKFSNCPAIVIRVKFILFLSGNLISQPLRSHGLASESWQYYEAVTRRGWTPESRGAGRIEIGTGQQRGHTG